MRSMTFGFLIVCLIKKQKNKKTNKTNKTGEMLKAVSIQNKLICATYSAQKISDDLRMFIVLKFRQQLAKLKVIFW